MTIGKKIFSSSIVVLFVFSLFPAVAAYAANVADTPFSYNVDYNKTADTMTRAKTDRSKVYVKCTKNTGTAYVQANGSQKGTTYVSGTKYPLGIGTQYLTNNVWEKRPATNVTAYAYLRFSNPNYAKNINTTGYWSPDNSSGIGL